METASICVDTLKRLIKDLEDAINVCYNVDGSSDEKSYPYAAGYSRSAMQTAVDTLKNLKLSEK